MPTLVAKGPCPRPSFMLLGLVRFREYFYSAVQVPRELQASWLSAGPIGGTGPAERGSETVLLDKDATGCLRFC